MEIRLDDEQLEKLLELVYLGDWLATAHDEPAIREDNYRDIKQLVYGLAAERGDDRIVFDPELQSYVPTAELAGELDQRFVSAYDEHIFWDELIDRLSHRDFDRQFADGELDDALATRAEDRIYDEYSREFHDHGIDHLEVVEP